MAQDKLLEMMEENRKLRRENLKLEHRVQLKEESNRTLGFYLTEAYFENDLHIIGGKTGESFSVKQVLLENALLKPCKICGYLVSKTHDKVHCCHGERKCYGKVTETRYGKFKCTETRCRCFRKPKKCHVKDCQCKELFSDPEFNDPRCDE